MPDRAPPNKWLGHLIHLNRRLHPRIHVLLLQRILQRERVDDSRQHPHVIGGYTIHVLGLLRDAAEEISATHYDRDLHAKLLHIGDLSCDAMDALRGDTKALV